MANPASRRCSPWPKRALCICSHAFPFFPIDFGWGARTAGGPVTAAHPSPLRARSRNTRVPLRASLSGARALCLSLCVAFSALSLFRPLSVCASLYLCLYLCLVCLHACLAVRLGAWLLSGCISLSLAPRLFSLMLMCLCLSVSCSYLSWTTKTRFASAVSGTASNRNFGTFHHTHRQLTCRPHRCTITRQLADSVWPWDGKGRATPDQTRDS